MSNIVGQKTLFQQQKLRACEPHLSVEKIILVFIGIGGIFLLIGTIILCTNNSVKEKMIRYSNDKGCLRCEENIMEKFMNGTPINCKCHIIFDLNQNWDEDVSFYYELKNFYQNVRRFAISRDNAQLRGELHKDVDPQCKPFDKLDDGTPIAPCGAVANSMFTDVFELEYISLNQTNVVPLSYKNIAWDSDKLKFKNPKGKSSKESFKGFAKPKQWTKHIYELDLNDSENNGFQNQDFKVWMQTAAFNPFRKLYRRLDRSKETMFRNGLPQGQYKLNIQYNYPIKDVGGEKIFVLSTTSWLGGGNWSLGVCYIAAGSFCLIFAALLFYLIKRVKPESCERRHSNRM